MTFEKLVNFHLLHMNFVLSLFLEMDSMIVFFLLNRFGNVFLWDSGSSVGSVSGHSKAINAVDYKPTRPFRICTASEDSDVGFFEGPPFKFSTSNKVSIKIFKH